MQHELPVGLEHLMVHRTEVVDILVCKLVNASLFAFAIALQNMTNLSWVHGLLVILIQLLLGWQIGQEG